MRMSNLLTYYGHNYKDDRTHISVGSIWPIPNRYRDFPKIETDIEVSIRQKQIILKPEVKRQEVDRDRLQISKYYFPSQMLGLYLLLNIVYSNDIGW